ncbi:hypothetical protein [Xanthomonas campestris]|uniref:hypothetical protein n=1 Tax=Xanthomonas campestris TaxID=339 RepID=UPI00237868E3|nr:hypothetical protein [Xanthomonas campestris]WDK04532.1 hypothetical protein JH273_21700 [Xanthomonas campestris]
MKKVHKQFASAAGISLALLSPLPQAVCAGHVSTAAMYAATIAVSALVTAAILAKSHKSQALTPVVA